MDISACGNEWRGVKRMEHNYVYFLPKSAVSTRQSSLEDLVFNQWCLTKGYEKYVVSGIHVKC